MEVEAGRGEAGGVRRVERRLRWAWCLPMLLALLSSGALPAVGRGAMGVLEAGAAGTIQAPAVSSTHPLAVGDAEARVATQRGEGSSARFVVVPGQPVYLCLPEMSSALLRARGSRSWPVAEGCCPRSVSMTTR